MNLQGDFLRHLQRVRKDMEQTGEDLKNRYVEAQAGGKKVEVVFNGRQEPVKLSIDPELLKPGADGKADVALLEDLILAAVAQGIEKSKALMKEELDRVSGGLGGALPGFF